MKLVEGETLAALLDARPDPSPDRSRLLSVFLHVCQTMAYAHSRGVIHRDLKPSNIMVGSFNEVLVMDWGLSKVLARGGVADEPRIPAPAKRDVETVRSGSAGSQSVVGSVMGTVAYMPPEQAQGEVDRTDARSDVFSLGAVLCHILTGAPPYDGESVEEVGEKAREARLDEAFARLDNCGADQELVRLARRCLAARPDRPHDAGVLAEEFSSYFSRIEQCLRASELEVARATSRASSERRARRMTLGLAVSIVAALIILGGGYAWIESDRKARSEDADSRISVALEEATLLWGEARKAAGGDLDQWKEAMAAVEKAMALARDPDAGAALHLRVTERRAAMKTDFQDAKQIADDNRRDDEMARRLDQIRERLGQSYDRAALHQAYVEAFRTYGLVIDAGDPESSGRLRQLESLRQQIEASPIAPALTDAILCWRRFAPRESPQKGRLRGLCMMLDPDLRRLGDAAGKLDELRQIVKRGDFASWSTTLIEALATNLITAGDATSAVEVLTVARALRPDDYWVVFRLGHALYKMSPPRFEDSAAVWWAALGIRPDSAPAWMNLGFCLGGLNELAGAIEAETKAVGLAPEYVLTWSNLAESHRLAGNVAEAQDAYHEFLERVESGFFDGSRQFREVLIANAHFRIGAFEYERGNFGEAEGRFRSAIDHDDSNSLSHVNLIIVLGRVGDPAGLLAEHKRWVDVARKAVEQSRKKKPASLGTLKEAILAWVRALEDEDQLEKAIEIIEARLEKFPDSFDIGALRRKLEQLKEDL